MYCRTSSEFNVVYLQCQFVLGAKLAPSRGHFEDANRKGNLKTMIPNLPLISGYVPNPTLLFYSINRDCTGCALFSCATLMHAWTNIQMNAYKHANAMRFIC